MQDVNNLSDAALNWAAALASERRPCLIKPYPSAAGYVALENEVGVIRWNPAGDWALGGQLIDLWKIQLCPPDSPVHRNYGPGDSRSGMAESGMWTACTWSNRRADGRRSTGWGETALVAAMRCFVRLKLGDTVVIPQEVLDASR